MDSDDTDDTDVRDDSEEFSYERNCQVREVRTIGPFNKKKERIAEFTVIRCKAVDIRDPFNNTKEDEGPWRRVRRGTTVLISGEDESPMMALVHEVYKVVSGGDGDEEDALMKVTWLYRDKEVKARNKRPSSCKIGSVINKKKESGSVREVFYTAHSDHVLAHHVIHPCLVHFQSVKDPLPCQTVKIGQHTVQKQMKGFVCRRFFDTNGKKCYNLDDVANDVRAITFEDHLVLEVQKLLQASRRQLDAWLEHTPKWYHERQPPASARDPGEPSSSAGKEGALACPEVVGSSNLKEGASKAHGQQPGSPDGAEEVPSRKRARIDDCQGGLRNQKAEPENNHKAWRHLERTISDPGAVRLGADTAGLTRRRSADSERSKWESGPDGQSQHSGSVPPGCDERAHQKPAASNKGTKPTMKTNKQQVSPPVPTNEDEDPVPLAPRSKKEPMESQAVGGNGDLSKFIKKHGNMFDVKIPKEFTHGGEARTELVFGGRFKSRAEAEKVCLVTLKMGRTELKEYVKANAIKFGADPLTGRPPPEPVEAPTLDPRLGSLKRGSKGSEALRARPWGQKRQKRPRQKGAPSGEASPTPQALGPPLSHSPEAGTPDAEPSPSQDLSPPLLGMPTDSASTSLPLADGLTNMPSPQESLTPPLSADPPCNHPLSVAGKGASAAGARALAVNAAAEASGIAFKGGGLDGPTSRSGLGGTPDVDLGRRSALDSAMENEATAGSNSGQAAATPEPASKGTETLLEKFPEMNLQCDSGAKLASDNGSKDAPGPDNEKLGQRQSPDAQDENEADLAVGVELRGGAHSGQEGPLRAAPGSDEVMWDSQQLSGYIFRDCLICMEPKLAGRLEFTEAFLDTTIYRGLWDRFLGDLDRGVSAALVVKVDRDSNECNMLLSIRQSRKSGGTDGFRFTLFATRWVLAWPRTELRDGVQDWQEGGSDELPPDFSTSGQGAYIEDDSSVIMGGCIGMGGFSVWLTVEALVQLGYLEEALPAGVKQGGLPRTVPADGEGSSMSEGDGASEGDDEEIDIG